MSDDYLDLLRAEKARGRTTADIARQLGFARTSISLLLSGNYPAARAPKIEAKVLEVFGRAIVCPHLGAEIERDACDAHRTSPMPTSSADRLRHWTACRTCTQNPAAPAAMKRK
ncbi:hypothetical protein [Paracoccus sanguinis]|uniref:Uncharacterized protein n=1 Tax=Paracoccus sanguinis TaxID=1545044 RepID=A0A1H2SN70_9RHOB|nr:hypothetical protein [Paracoccus sanguinis]KGJ19332.1 hypothetical protein IX57_00280 [Paracoccus sanguinis]SDW33038.1 hypothetical protein SAMN05444276_101679 [Paracoccus sanguinis]